MEKKTILVGMSGRNAAFGFMNIVIDSLTSRGIDIVRIDHDINKFETRHAKVWFVYSVGQIIHRTNLEIDAIFGEAWGELLKRAKPDAVIASRDHVGLVDYICQVEREASEWPANEVTKRLMNSAYGCGGRLTSEQVRSIFEEATKKYYSILKGENNMNAVMNDIVHGKEAYLVTDSGLVPVRIDNIEMSTAEPARFEGHVLTPAENYVRNDVRTLADIAKGLLARCSTPKTSIPGIKTVHFSGPCTVVIWEDKTKTVVRCKDGEKPDYEKGLAMAIAKKALGTNKSGSNYYDIFKKWLPKSEEE